MKTPKIFRNKKELLFGNIESISESSVSGWLTHRDHTKLPVTVEIVLNDTVIGNGIADTFREDLSQQGLGDCGFNIVFNQKIEPMRLIEDGTILSNGKEYAVAEFAKSNELLRSKEHIPQITGSIDRVDSLMIGGWMKIEGVNSAAPFIIFSLRNKIIAYAIAGQTRPDLEAAGIGARGFQCVPLRPYSISNFLKHGIAEVNGYATNVSKFTQSLSPHSDAQKVESDRPLLYFWPDNREHNCYLDAIYSAQDSKIECQPGDLEDAINEIENGNRKVVFHLHWVTPVIGPVHSDSRRQAVERFVARLRNFQQLGGKVVWTVHNLLGHDADRRAWELSLSRKVADIADLILVHNQEVQRRICETYRTTSSKIKIVDHPSYEGFYKNEISRKEARQQLRIKPNSIVFGFIGQLRPYKGIEELVIAFAKFRQRHPQAELIIAGRRVHPFDLRALAAKTKAIPGIHLYEGHIKNDDLQLYYKAIDASVLPYRDILTSGSVLCSASFSVPVIGPMCPALSTVVEDNVSGILYKTSSSLTENAHAIESCMERFSELSATEVDKMNLSILESVDQLQPRKISERLFSEVFEVLEKTTIQREHEYRGVKYFCSEAFHTRETTAAAIVLNYGDPSKARNTIKSLKESEDADNLEIVLVDNNSPGLTFENLLSSFQGVTVIQTQSNLGYAGGNNLAVKHVLDSDKAIKFIWIVNPDTEVQSGAYQALIQASNKLPDHGIFGSIVADSRDETKIAFGGRMIDISSFSSLFTEPHSKIALVDKPTSPWMVDAVSGASMFIRREVFEKAGLIPEEYFLYFEETDFCLRARDAGFKIAMVPDSMVLHFKDSESGDLPKPYYAYYFVRGFILFIRRNAPDLEKNSPKSHLRNTHIKPWLERVKTRNQDYFPVLEQLFEAGLQDGDSGITGPTQLNTLPLRPMLEAYGEIGYIESLDGIRLVGWSHNPQEPWLPSSTLVLIDDSHYLEARDLGSYYLNDDPSSGFLLRRIEFVIPKELCTGHMRKIELVSGTHWKRATGAFEYFKSPDYSPVYETSIDMPSGEWLNGSAWNSNMPEHPLEIKVAANGSVIDIVAATDFRGDLQDCRGGHVGWRSRIPRTLYEKETAWISIYDAYNGRLLNECKVQWKTDSKLIKGKFESGHYLSWLASRVEIDRADSDAFDQVLARADAWKHSFLANCPTPSLGISIIMPVFNREDEIEQSVQSILRQSYQNWELLIVDDGSTDASAEVIEEMLIRLDDKRIMFFPQTANRGVSAARNVGLSMSSREIITYLDSDNEWDSDYLMITAAQFSDESIECAYAGQLILEKRFNGKRSIEEPISVRSAPFLASVVKNRNYIDLNAFSHRKSLYNQYSGFNERMRRLVDWELIVRYANSNNTAFIPAVLSNYMIGRASNQITATERFDKNLIEVEKTLQNISTGPSSTETESLDHNGYIFVIYSGSPDLESEIQAHRNARFGFDSKDKFIHVAAPEYRYRLKDEFTDSNDWVFEPSPSNEFFKDSNSNNDYIVLMDCWHSPRCNSITNAIRLFEEDSTAAVTGTSAADGRTRNQRYKKGHQTNPFEFDANIVPILESGGLLHLDGKIDCLSLTTRYVILKPKYLAGLISNLRNIHSAVDFEELDGFFSTISLLGEKIQYTPDVIFDDQRSWLG